MQYKIQVFGWRLLHGFLPTRNELGKRGILHGNHNLVCAFFFQDLETISHIGFSCVFTKSGMEKSLLMDRHIIGQ